MSGVLLGSGLNHTFMNSYYAAGNTVIPTKIGVYTYTLGVALKIAGFFLAGLTGIAFAISLSTLVQAVLLFSFLQPQRLPAFTKHAWEKPQAGQHLPQHGTEDWPVPEPALKDYQPFVEDPAPDL
jgi:peptidoglycan biosynthesis protein MviN/MurJ (putative lipid II flippase)